MKKIFYFFALLFIAIYSYNGYEMYKNSHLKVYNEGKLSAIAEDIIAIPLETKEECRIKKIEKVRATSSYLFIASQGRLFQFTDKGKYIRQITPFSLTDFTIDTQHQRIIAIEQQHMVSYYDFNGNRLATQDLSANPTWDKLHKIEFFHDSLWITADLLFQDSSNPAIQRIETHICRFDTEFNLLESQALSPANIGRPANEFFLTPEPVVTHQGEVYAFSPSMEPDYLLEDTLFIAKTTVQVNAGLIASGNLFPVRRSGRFMLANYRNRTDDPSSYAFCYDIKEHKAYYSKEGFKDDLLKTGTITDLCALNMQNTSFCFVKGSKDTYKLFPERQEQDNPVVFIFNLKA